MDGKGGLQLLPGTKKRLGIKVPGENKFLYIGSAILGATLVTMFAMGRYESSLMNQVNGLNDQLVALEQKRNKKDEAELVLMGDRLRITSNLIKEHYHWTSAFDWLENILQQEVQVQNLSVNPKGEFIIGAAATNYVVIARQIAALLADNRVITVDVGKMESTAEGTVEFNLEMLVDSEKLIKKE